MRRTLDDLDWLPEWLQPYTDQELADTTPAPPPGPPSSAPPVPAVEDGSDEWLVIGRPGCGCSTRGPCYECR